MTMLFIAAIFPNKINPRGDHKFRTDFISLIIGKKFSLITELLPQWFIWMLSRDTTFLEPYIPVSYIDELLRKII